MPRFPQVSIPAFAEWIGLKQPRDETQPLELGYQELATKKRDELYLERMRRKRRGEEGEERAPMPKGMQKKQRPPEG